MKFGVLALCVALGASPSHSWVLPASSGVLFTGKPLPTDSLRAPTSSALRASVQRPDVTKKDKRREYMAKDSYFK